jgi:hypothetical protein
MKVQEREFFDAAGIPEIAAAVNAATRRKLIEKLEKKTRSYISVILPLKIRREKRWIISVSVGDMN